jgi:hypothetical protein
MPIRVISVGPILLVALVAATAGAVAHASGGAGEVVAPAPPVVPFAVGEEMTYRLRARWGIVSGSGEAALRVEAKEAVHGFPAYRLAMSMRGGVAIFRIDDVQRSWLDVEQLFSRRFEQKLNQTGYRRDRTYDFLPAEMRYVRVGHPADGGELATPFPLDDVSFIYHVRTLPLAVGRSYTEPRYYKSEGNPVSVQVLRTERVTVPAGEFDAIVVRPIIQTDGLFSEGGEAEVWLSNDDRRIVLKLRAKVKVGTLTMELESYTPGRS